MKIEQNKQSNQHTFTFGKDTINFAYKDKSGSGDVDIPYGEIQKKSSIRIEQNLWLRNVGYLWCVLGSIQIGYALIAGKPLSGTGFWFVLGAVCVAWSIFTKVKYTIFQASNGSLYIIQDDKTHDKIIEELMSRRKMQLLEWYDYVDGNKSAESEIAKFKWLYEQEALTKEEVTQRISQVQAEYGVIPNLSPKTLH
mgnify:CR=1 FL=1